MTTPLTLSRDIDFGHRGNHPLLTTSGYGKNNLYSQCFQKKLSSALWLGCDVLLLKGSLFYLSDKTKNTNPVSEGGDSLFGNRLCSKCTNGDGLYCML